jgi:uncharacterized protein YdaU (DUF1376 family)
MKKDNPDSFMPLWIADYLADTTHLSCEQHGAYLLLLITYWRRGGHMPADNAFLCSVTKLTPQKWRTMRVVMGQFFREEDGQWKNKRADAEILKAAKLKKDKAAAGAKGAEKRWSGHGSAIDLPSKNDEKTIAKNGPTPSPTEKKEEPSSEKIVLVDSQGVCVERKPLPEPRPASKPLSSKVNRGTRWPAGQPVPPEWVAAGADRRAAFGKPQIDLALEAEKFTNFWTARSGSSASKIDWRATWLNWALNSNGVYANGRSEPALGQSGQPSKFQSDLLREIAAAEAADRSTAH